MRRFLTIILPAIASLVVFGMAVFLYVLPQLESAVMAEKRSVLQETVRSVVKLLGTYEHQVQQGLLTLNQAQARAKARVREMRYGTDQKEYFWIIDNNATMLMHPYVSRLDGKDMSQYRDPQGKQIFVEMVRAANQSGGGWVDYYWQWKDQPGRQAAKLSYVAQFEPWGWVVGTGFYVDDVTLAMEELPNKLFFSGLAALLLITAISGYLAWKNLSSDRDRQKMLAELTASEEKFRSISSGALDGVIMLDSGGKVIFWNQAAEAIFGYAEKEMLGRDLHQMLASSAHLMDARKGLEQFKALGSGAAVGRILELTAIRKDGGIIPVELSVSSLRVRDKWHAVGIVRDISQRKEAEEALRESELKYRALFESATDAIFVLQSDRIVDLNPRAEDMFRADKATLIGKSISELSPDWQPSGMASAMFEEAMAGPVRQGVPRYFDWMLKREDGSRFYGEVGLNRLTASDGNSILVVIRDVSARKEVEREREKARTVMADTFEQSPDGVLLLDNTGHPTIVNRAAADILGVPKQFLSRGIMALAGKLRFYDERGEEIAVREFEAMVLDSEAPSLSGLLRMVRRDGSEGWIEYRMAPVRDGQNQVVHRLLVFNDITERVRTREEREKLQAQLQQAQKLEAIGTLAGGIAHDFNNILTIIMGFAEVAMMRREKDDGFPDSELREIIEGSRRARDLVEQILTYSRGASSEKAPLDLVPVVDDACHLIRKATTRNVNLVVDLEPARAMVLANETQIQQIILNLANNAVHAMRDGGGTLEISLREETDAGAHFVLRVKDSGRGMAESQLGRVFDPFFTTKAPGEGTGLGLSVVHGLVKEHGGTIDIDSRVGRGTEVRVSLPKAAGAPVQTEKQDGQVVYGAGKVLLVDDDPDVLKALSNIIRCLGFVVDGCRNYSESVDKLGQDGHNYDMLITDYDMPGQDGLALARWAKEAGLDLPVVLISGSASQSLSQKAAEVGVDAFLQKPISLEAISQTIQTAMGRHPTRHLAS